MRKLRNISTEIWDDIWFEGLNAENKLLFMYLITNDNTNDSGVYDISIRKISFHTDLPYAIIRESLKMFEEQGKIQYIEKTMKIMNYDKHRNCSPVSQSKMQEEIELELALEQLYDNQMKEELEDQLAIRNYAEEQTENQ